ncbi:MAG: integrase arm-type DNA-binding domain-containing protein [Gallionellaceae bacterium]
MALSDMKVKAAKIPDGKKQVRLSDGAGLYLQVTLVGKYWRMNYRFGGKQKTLAIGVYPQVSLKEARNKRDAAKKQLEQNIDPSQSKQADKRKAVAATLVSTFEGVALEWLKKKEKQWAATTLKHKKAELNNHIFPWMGSIKIANIEATDVLSVCQRIENNGHHESAHRAKMLCGQILRYGVATGRIKFDPTRDLKGALLRLSLLQDRQSKTSRVPCGSI